MQPLCWQHEHKKAEDAENTRHVFCGKTRRRRGGACEYPNRLSFFSLTIITSYDKKKKKYKSKRLASTKRHVGVGRREKEKGRQKRGEKLVVRRGGGREVRTGKAMRERQRCGSRRIVGTDREGGKWLGRAAAKVADLLTTLRC